MRHRQRSALPPILSLHVRRRMDVPMKIELWPIARVLPYENNPRVNDDAVAVVAASLKEFGFRQPIVVDVDGVIIVGHTRFKAALQLGFTEVPVHVATDLTPDQIRAYRIADNQTATHSEWDYDKLPYELLDRKASCRERV